jgi:hypothetical protein
MRLTFLLLVFLLQLQDWSNKPDVEIIVPPKQLLIGAALIKTMYTRGKNLSTLSQQEQIQLLHLSDAYGVNPVSNAVCKSLSSIDTRSLKWETVRAVFALPAPIDALPFYESLKKAAVTKVQGVLGDLERVWSSTSMPNQRQLPLLDLPFSALVLLLASADTKVASEDTVFYTMDRWLQHNTGCSKEQQQKLAELLRLPYCTPSYLNSVICAPGSWILDYVSPLQICTAAVAATAGSSGSWSSNVLSASPAGASYRRLVKRPVSSMQELRIELSLDARELQRMFSEAVEHVDRPVRRTSDTGYWQGRGLRFDLVATCNSSAHAEEALALSVEFVLCPPASSSSTTSSPIHTSLEGLLVVERFGALNYEVEVGLDTSTIRSDRMGLEVNDALGLGGLPAHWAMAEQVLQEAGFLSEDSNALEISVRVKGFW